MSILGGIICGAVAYLVFLILVLVTGRRNAVRLDDLRREHYARIADHEHTYRGESSDGRPTNINQYRDATAGRPYGCNERNSAGRPRRRQ